MDTGKIEEQLARASREEVRRLVGSFISEVEALAEQHGETYVTVKLCGTGWSEEAQDYRTLNIDALSNVLKDALCVGMEEQMVKAKVSRLLEKMDLLK